MVDRQRHAIEVTLFITVGDVVVNRRRNGVQIGLRIGRKRQHFRSRRNRDQPDRRARRLVQMFVLPGDSYHGISGEVPAQLVAHTPVVILVVVLARRCIAQPAVTLVVDKTEAISGVRRDRGIQHGVDITCAVVSQTHVRLFFPVIFRGNGHHGNGTRRTIASEQRALGSLQHFDALNIVEGE